MLLYAHSLLSAWGCTFFFTQTKILPETSVPPESYAPHFIWNLRMPSLLLGILSISSLIALRLCSALEAACARVSVR